MILVDTSIWVDHLRTANRRLAALLFDEQVLCHPFIVGELACGGLRKRAEVLQLLGSLPETLLVEHDEVLAFIEAHGLPGSGVGWVDAHLLASAYLSGARLWTSDSRLGRVAQRLKMSRP